MGLAYPCTKYGNAVYNAMQTVIETPHYLADAKAAGISAEELAEIAVTIAADPEAGS